MNRIRTKFRRILSCNEDGLVLTLSGIRDAEEVRKNRESMRVVEMRKLSAEKAAEKALDWLILKQEKQVSANL